VKRVLVTGANGFVGNRLCRVLLKSGYAVRAVLRRSNSSIDCIIQDRVIVGDISLSANWKKALQNMDCIVHLAARVHVMKDSAIDPLAEYRKINVDATLNLARQAAQVGVHRFIFLSTIKVNGEQTQPGVPFTEKDIPAPADPYSISKYEAEKKLLKLAARTSMEVVIIRPVLVYGPGVKGNFASMMYYLYKGFPLPFGAIHNQRSLVALDNLVDLIEICINHPSAKNQVFLMSDGVDLSTTELFKQIAVALNVSPRLIPVPEKLLLLGATIFGKQALALRLLGSLQVDIAKAQALLGWNPPVKVDEAFRDAACHFLENVHL